MVLAREQLSELRIQPLPFYHSYSSVELFANGRHFSIGPDRNQAGGVSTCSIAIWPRTSNLSAALACQWTLRFAPVPDSGESADTAHNPRSFGRCITSECRNGFEQAILRRESEVRPLRKYAQGEGSLAEWNLSQISLRMLAKTLPDRPLVAGSSGQSSHRDISNVRCRPSHMREPRVFRGCVTI